VFEAEVFAGSSPVLAEDPETVRVVDHQPRAEFPLQRSDVGQVGDISFHGENTIDDDDLAAVGGGVDQPRPEVLDVIVLVLCAPCRRKAEHRRGSTHDPARRGTRCHGGRAGRRERPH